MAFFLQLGKKVDENGKGLRIKKTGNRFGGDTGSKGGSGSGTVQERRARQKKLATLLLTEQTAELHERRRR
jgi:hypothetical protein